MKYFVVIKNQYGAIHTCEFTDRQLMIDYCVRMKNEKAEIIVVWAEVVK